MKEAYIYDAVRTPRGKGKPGGALYEVKPVDLLAAVLNALRERCAFDTALVGDAIIGCVTAVQEQGFNIGKAALAHAGWHPNAGALQINRYCASGLEAVNLASLKIMHGGETLMVAGGVESMSRVPMGSEGGAFLYDPEIIQGSGYIPQGVSADLIATMEDFSREMLDAYALQSQQRAAVAQQNGWFDRSLVPIFDKNGLPVLEKDENIRPELNPEILAAMPPVFGKIGAMGFDEMALKKYPAVEKIQHRHTAATSSGLADGAAAVLLGDKSAGEALGLRPRAKVRSFAAVGSELTIMLTGPTPAAQKALQQAGMKPADIDLWEMNEAFASPVLKFQKDLGIPDDKINVNGGAIALGHPLGATGAMLLGILLDELERRDLHTGLVTLCAGGGMGVATIIERT